jgi:transcription termination/antitermination protein NusA
MAEIIVSMSAMAAFRESGIKTVDDLAGCATDDLFGWTDDQASPPLRHRGVLDGLGVSREQCGEMILDAGVKAGWIER